MRTKLVTLCFGFALAVASVGVVAGGSHSTKGYVKKSGTYVAPAHATNPDKSRLNNWSTKGNVNPYTGKPGTKNPYKPPK